MNLSFLSCLRGLPPNAFTSWDAEGAFLLSVRILWNVRTTSLLPRVMPQGPHWICVNLCEHVHTSVCVCGGGTLGLPKLHSALNASVLDSFLLAQAFYLYMLKPNELINCG